MTNLRVNFINKDFIHFFTFTVIEWIDVFTQKQYSQILIDSLQYCRKAKGLNVFGYVIMSNHLHLLANTKNNSSEKQNKQRNSLADIIRDFKKWTTYKIRDELKKDNRRYIYRLLSSSYQKKDSNQFQLWQANNYPEVISSEKVFIQKLNYIHANPVRKGYVEKPEDWLYSSAKYYSEQIDGVLQVDNLYK